MSYEIVKSISRKKDNRIFITSASNNIWPRTYSKWEYMPNEKCSDEELKNKELYLFHGILGNSYQLSNNVNKNWNYALNKFYEYCNQNKIDTYDLWDLRYKDGIEALKPYYDVFNNFYKERINGKFYLYSNIGYINKVNNKSFGYNSIFNQDEYCKDYKTIYNDYCKISKYNKDYYKIGICKFEKDNTHNMKMVDKVIPTDINDAEYPRGNVIYDEEIQIDDLESVYKDGRVRVIITKDDTNNYYSVYTYDFGVDEEIGYCYGIFDVTEQEVNKIGGIDNLVYETITGEQEIFTSYGLGVSTGKSIEELETLAKDDLVKAI